jgi:monofunctional biosynthetic peptidoglycan transglycosylase
MGEVSCSPVTPRRTTVPAVLALCALLLALLSSAAYTVHCLVLERLGQRLSRRAGVSVRIGGLRGRLAPATVIVEDVEVGDPEGPVHLQLGRAEAELKLLFHGRRPLVKRVRLVRPALRLERDARPRTTTRSLAREGRSGGSPSRLLDTPVEILDGELAVSDGASRLSSTGIFLLPGRAGRARLVVGGTELSRKTGSNTAWQLRISSAAVGLRGLRPTRVAVLGGSLHLPGSPDAALGIHSLTAEPLLDGLQIQLVGKTAGRRTGSFRLKCQLDGELSPELVDLDLQNLELTALEPVLERFGLRVRNTRVTGRLALARDRRGYRLRVGPLLARGLRIEHPLLADRMIGPFDPQLGGDLALSLDGSSVALRELTLVTDAVVLTLKGALSGDGSNGGSLAALELTMPKTPCQDVLASFPRGFAPALEGMALSGDLGVKAHLRLDTADLEATEVGLDLEPLGCRVVADPPRADPNALKGEVTIAVTGPHGRGMQWPLGPSNPDWKPYRRISRNVRTAFLVAEDGRFFDHQGFDEAQLRRAFISNLQEGRLRRGASTISQQLVKNVFLSHRRTLARKLQEAVLTWRMEQVIPKRRILELYLNMVEMGPGVYGVAQAARHYFGRAVRRLTPLQAAHLAALTPSPRHMGQRFQSGAAPGAVWTEKLHMLLRMMRRAGTITRAEQKRWTAERLTLLKH